MINTTINTITFIITTYDTNKASLFHYHSQIIIILNCRLWCCKHLSLASHCVEASVLYSVCSISIISLGEGAICTTTIAEFKHITTTAFQLPSLSPQISTMKTAWYTRLTKSHTCRTQKTSGKIFCAGSTGPNRQKMWCAGASDNSWRSFGVF